MEIFYESCVIKLNDESGRERPLVSAGSIDFEKSVIDAKKSTEYYKTECGYTVRIEITELCPVCNNSSRGIFHPFKRNKFLGTWKKCPNCNGKFPDKVYPIF